MSDWRYPNRVWEWRDIRPDGTVLSTWVDSDQTTVIQDYDQFGPIELPRPPWQRQRREPGGEWVTVATFLGSGEWQLDNPDGTMLGV